jgi:hypothetical protein
MYKMLLKYTGREALASDEGFILDYLMRCYQEARNLGIILRTAPEHRGRLRDEIVA